MRFGIHPVIPVRDGMVLRFPGNSHQSIHHGGSQYCYGHHHEFSINVMVYNQWYGLWSSSWVLISKPHIGIEETEIGTSWGHIQRGLFSDRMGTSNKIQSSLEFEYRLPKHWWFIIFFPIESCSPWHTQVWDAVNGLVASVRSGKRCFGSWILTHNDLSQINPPNF